MKGLDYFLIATKHYVKCCFMDIVQFTDFYVKAENTRDFSRGMNRLIFLKSDTKIIANIRSVC